MELDGYNEGLGLAFEYNGQQHYKPVSLFGGEEGFKQTQERDKLKSKLCAENGVILIYLTSFIICMLLEGAAELPIKILS